MKKILLVTFEYPTGKKYCGGVGQVVKQCRDTLVALGYKTYVLISSEFRKKYPVRLLDPDSNLVNYDNLFSFEKEHDWAAFDYIIQHFVNWTERLRLVKKNKPRRPKIVYHFHSILRRERESGFKTLNYFLLNQERMISIADKIICPSRYEYDNFCRYFPNFSDKLVVVENTIESFPPFPGKIREFKAQYNIGDKDIVSLYVGRLERIKGIGVMLENIPKLLARHSGLKFFIIGKSLEKDLYGRLMKMVKRFPRKVFYIKYLDKESLFQLYYLSNIYINPSLSESFSLSTHEGAFCRNALLLNRLPVFEKFKDAAMFFSSHGSGEEGFLSSFEVLIKHKKIRDRLSRKASAVAKEFLVNNRLREDLSGLLKSF
ncbi:MAG: glycosyltransferase family 4 protein [Candidatus Omnitrophica bacterium]|nr:glycosyltransferase family 4 protein [Candidatus Omnitrophota bacterium]MDD5500698.1 glycosyltransferase family 4 protein [Candidatus Omnitrophota bacterium]